MRSDRFYQHRLELALVLAFALMQLPLIAAGLGLAATHPTLLGLGTAASVGIALAVVSVSHNGQRLAHMVLCMLLFGNLGMLVGTWLDFGQGFLIGLTHWCHMHPGLDPSTIVAKLTGAPWSYGLMLAGCNLGMLLSDLVWHRRALQDAVPTRRRTGIQLGSLRCYLGCNLGMLSGMLLAEGLLPGGHHHHHIEVGGVLTMAALMGAGMTFGMLIGLRMAGSFGFPWQRSTSAV
jgi:hypothetical protein